MLEPLGVHSLALDLRGHGLTELPADQSKLVNWQTFADDIAYVFDDYIEGPIILAGHSYGAVSALLALPRIQNKVAGYAGFDPVLVPWLFQKIAKGKIGRGWMKRRIPIARKAGDRKSVFESIDAAFSRYQGRGAFKAVPDDVLRDYLEGGTVEAGDGTIRLACDPKWEQAIFVAQAHNAVPHLSLLPSPSRLIFAGGKGQVSSEPQRRRLARKFPHISVEFEKNRDHLFPLHDPDFASSVLSDVLNRAGQGPAS